MKKVLAVVLAVIMTFSLGSAAFASELRTEVLPGKMVIVAQNEHIEAGKSYSIPVSVVSDLTVNDADGNAITEGDIYLGFTASKGGNAAEYITIDDVKLSDEVKSASGFEVGECQYNELDDELAWVSFKISDLSILHSDNFVIAYIDVTVASTYPGNGLDATLDLGSYDMGILPDVNANFEAYNGSAGIVTADGTFNEIISTGGYDSTQLIINPGFLADSFEWDPEPEPTFWEKVVAFFKNIALKVVQFGITALTLAESWLKGEI